MVISLKIMVDNKGKLLTSLHGSTLLIMLTKTFEY